MYEPKRCHVEKTLKDFPALHVEPFTKRKHGLKDMSKL